MAEPFLSEIRLMSFNFAPKGWALCNGQFLPINQNQALFALLGTTYGGNGQTTFALPDLRGRVPIHMGSGHTLGERSGQETHTVSINEMPAHIHTFGVHSGDATTDIPVNGVPAGFSNGYRSGGALASLEPSSIASVGGNQPHENRQPYLVISYCIALQGIFPSQN